MTVKELYGFCVNLNGSSLITLRSPNFDEIIAQGRYAKIGAEYGEREALIFRVEDDTDITIYVRG